jgi:hypothetical protein
VGVAAAPWAGAELAVDVRVVGAAEREALDEDDDEGDEDDELLADDVPDDESLVAVEDRSAGELSAVDVAGAVGVGEDGVAGVVPDDDERSVSSPRVVVPEDDVLLTSADTGFCPISSIPVTIAIATTKTETA